MALSIAPSGCAHLNGAYSMTANSIQIGGDHYRNKSVQPWDYIAANNLNYFEGCIVKYVSRWQEKGGVSDLKKAAHYLQKLIEIQDAGQKETAPFRTSQEVRERSSTSHLCTESTGDKRDTKDEPHPTRITRPFES